MKQSAIQLTIPSLSDNQQQTIANTNQHLSEQLLTISLIIQEDKKKNNNNNHKTIILTIITHPICKAAKQGPTKKKTAKFSDWFRVDNLSNDYSKRLLQASYTDWTCTRTKSGFYSLVGNPRWPIWRLSLKGFPCPPTVTRKQKTATNMIQSRKSVTLVNSQDNLSVVPSAGLSSTRQKS